MKKKRPTIQDVAKQAGVSKATVSKYLNNIPYVAVSTRKKIERAIQELDFHPSTFARGLVNKSLRLIGLVISDFEIMMKMELIKAVETEASKYGYTVVLVSAGQNEDKLIELLSTHYRHLDGIILANVTNDGFNISRLSEVFENIVMVHRHIESVPIDYTVVDGYLGGKLAAEYLIGLGHKEIAMIAGPERILQFEQRVQGFKDTLIEYGIEKQALFIHTDQTVEAGYRAAENIRLEKKSTSAIFASTDYLAFGVLEAARQYGWSIPDELSVIGFDNIFFSELARVPLTTIDGRIKDLGVSAVEILNRRIQGKEHLEQIKLRPSLVVRDSCSRPINND